MHEHDRESETSLEATTPKTSSSCSLSDVKESEGVESRASSTEGGACSDRDIEAVEIVLCRKNAFRNNTNLDHLRSFDDSPMEFNRRKAFKTSNQKYIRSRVLIKEISQSYHDINQVDAKDSEYENGENIPRRLSKTKSKSLTDIDTLSLYSSDVKCRSSLSSHLHDLVDTFACPLGVRNSSSEDETGQSKETAFTTFSDQVYKVALT